jgi:hypothetical protein
LPDEETEDICFPQSLLLRGTVAEACPLYCSIVRRTILFYQNKKQIKSEAFSPQTEYINLSTAEVGEVMPTFAGEGCCVVVARIPMADNLGFQNGVAILLFHVATE